MGVVGDIEGLKVGDKVGSADAGEGSGVVGNMDGLGVGMVDGMELGEEVGIIVGDGVVGERVIMFVGDLVGDGVGVQVEHTNVREVETLGRPNDG